MTDSTPFAHWRGLGGEDPHGDLYNGEEARKRLAAADIPCDVLADMLVNNCIRQTFNGIGILTAAKERLRWLSRELYRITKDHQGVNTRRAQTRKGHLTDDELANAFFMSEAPEDLKAGRHRIIWLLKEIEDAQQ